MSPAEQVAQFNQRCHVGDLVERLDDLGKKHRTRVKYPATLTESGTPVVWVEDLAGYYLLERVTPLFTFFDCYEGCEELTWSDPEEALDSHLDDCYEVGSKESRAETIARVAPLTVYEFAHVTVPEGWADNEARRLFERLEERFADDFGSLDLEYAPWDSREHGALEQALTAVVRTAVERADVWRCEIVGKKQWSEDELRALYDEAELAERGV